jgi:hypothetical protein
MDAAPRRVRHYRHPCIYVDEEEVKGWLNGPLPLIAVPDWLPVDRSWESSEPDEC